MRKGLLVIILFLLVNTACGQHFPVSEGDFFGQNPPGDSAVIFAPDIFSLPDRMESRITFSQDGKAIFFEVMEIENNKVSSKIYSTQYLNNSWTEQVEVPFSTNYNVGKPYLSADGDRLFFTKDGDIWMVERAGQGWSEPQALPSPINSTSIESSYMETADGAVYISSKRPGGLGGIDNWRINRLSDQSFQAENLGPILNSPSFDFSPFVAPDGSYLIFSSDRNGRSGRAHLYISFNKGNDMWTEPINMNSAGAEVNNDTANHNSPIISPDGKFLFFVRHETINVMDVYWVNASIIDELREISGLTP